MQRLLAREFRINSFRYLGIFASFKFLQPHILVLNELQYHPP